MAKWKELPTTVVELKALYAKLKDREMKLEADLAIKENPAVEDAITMMALALSEVKKADEALKKSERPESEEDRVAVDALVNRIKYLENQLADARTLLQAKAGKAGDKLIDLRTVRDQSFEQLKSIASQAGEVLTEHGLDLNKLMPSLTDFLKVENNCV